MQLCKGFGRKNYSFSFEDFIETSLADYKCGEVISSRLMQRNAAVQGLGDIISRLQYDVFSQCCLDVYGKNNVHFFTYESFFGGDDYKRLMALIYEGNKYSAA